MTAGNNTPRSPKKRKKKKKISRKLREERKLKNKARELLGFQKNYPFSNKFFGNAYPNTIPEAMYFNPISQDIGGIPKLTVDEKSNLYIHL